MNELKKELIQQILETQDERLLKMMLDILKLNDEQPGYHNILESTFVIWAAGVKGNVPQGLSPEFVSKSSQMCDL